MSAQGQNPRRWKAFTSLDWYDGAIEFLFRFVAKTSEPLLAAGIVYSAADVLSKGHLGSTNATMDNLWAISQALAIESSGGVVLVYGLESFKARDRVKAWMYLVLSALLALTGGVMLFMQLAGLENQQADSPLMRSLFALRCVVSVGYIYLCRTKSMSFRDLDKEKPDAAVAPVPAAQEQQPAQIDYQRLAQELAPLLQAVRTTIIEEVRASITGPEARAVPGISERKVSQKQPRLLLETEKPQGNAKRSEEPTLPIGERLEAAYQELAQASQGQYISGRALAKLVHIDRQTCTSWLKKAHPENLPGPHLATTASQPETEVTTINSQQPATATTSQTAREVTATDLQPETIATEPPSLATDLRPATTITANSPEVTATHQPLIATSHGTPQFEVTAIDREPLQEITATEQPLEKTSVATPEEETTAAGEQTAAISESESKVTTSQPQPAPTATDPEILPEVTATEARAGTVTTRRLQPGKATTGPVMESKKTAATPRPRKKAGQSKTDETRAATRRQKK
ncbi:MAG TPA: hypothetical protein VFV38_50040 [Ktedonobacteraceae bacterium]|nr:hypothetical protein [Ktedonobacteraceae bacterium]